MICLVVGWAVPTRRYLVGATLVVAQNRKTLLNRGFVLTLNEEPAAKKNTP
jgi:hypothetical protein